MKKIVFVLTLFLVTNFFAQEKVYYNFAVNNCSEDNAENLINKCIKGSYLLNYDFTSIDGKAISTDKIKKPIVIIAGATWSAPCWVDVHAVNQMVEKYDDKLQFVMILWDKEAKAKRIADKLDSRVAVVPARDGDKIERGYLDVSGFVHKLDYPTAYLISKDKQFVEVKRGAVSPSKELTLDQAKAENAKNFEAFLAPVLQ